MGNCTSNLKGTKLYPKEGSVVAAARKSTDSDTSACNDAYAICVHPGMYVGKRSNTFRDYYEPSKKLGSGAYGDVFLCKDKSTGAERAVKVINKTIITPASLNNDDNLLKEVHYLKQLDHPNIARLYDFFEDKKAYYIVMDICHGGELFDEIISRHKFNECDAINLIKQILSGVCYLHKHNIVHRDLKPENLLFESKDINSSIKIVDFGLSTHMSSGNLRERLGTAYYIAPEVLKKHYDEKCDIWSCGVILYILLCGYPPFGGSTDASIIAKVEKGVYKFPKREWECVSADAIDLVRRMLTLDPKQRPSADEVLQHPEILKYSQTNRTKLTTKKQSHALKNLMNFRKTQKLAEAAMLLMASKLTTAEETKELTRLFADLDTNGDGRLERGELVQGYAKIMQRREPNFTPDPVEIEREVDEILKAVDFDMNGYVDYSEFVTGCMDKSMLLSKERLRAAFSTFDTDGSGKISKKELATIFGLADFTDDTWKCIVKDIDANDDGEVDFEEFVDMVQNNI